MVTSLAPRSFMVAVAARKNLSTSGVMRTVIRLIASVAIAISMKKPTGIDPVGFGLGAEQRLLLVSVHHHALAISRRVRLRHWGGGVNSSPCARWATM